MKIDGWVLDAYIDGDYAYLWLKTVEGKILLIKERYRPDFYLIPLVDEELADLSQLITTHPNVTSTAIQKKYVSIDSRQKKNVLHITVDRISKLQKVIRDVEGLGRHKAISNLDLPHIQRYLINKELPPTQKILLEYNSDNRLISHQVLDDGWEVKPPPFTTLIFDIDGGEAFNPEDVSEEIKWIKVMGEGLTVNEKLTGDETDILTAFQEKISAPDIDFLISDNISAIRLLSRARMKQPEIQFGRRKTNVPVPLKGLISHGFRGRAWVDIGDYLHMGLAGINERCRFTYAPPRLCASWPAGKTIDARQCYEALKSGIIIPTTYPFYKDVLTVKELAYRDRGGLILSPQVGLHENVGELDFESMFPNIIIKENISYETATPTKVNTSRRGLLPRMTEEVLKRRLHFKHLKKIFREDSGEYRWCEQRDLVLKQVLVCIYGYSGCFANRFSNVSAYEEINRKARDLLVKSMNMALEDGYQIVYADTDSIFVKKKGAVKEDYRSLASKIEREINLPIALDHYYKFLVLLPQEADPDMEASRRYFGKLMDGRLHYRGIELRRHDTPEFLKKFQERLINILFDADDSVSIVKTQINKAINHVFEAYDRLMNREIATGELVINKVLRKPLNEYSSILPHVAAAIQAQQHGASIRKGETISFVYTGSENPNPLRRVLNVKLLNGEHESYNEEKYGKLLLDASETILGIFGFNASMATRSEKLNGFQRKI